jgi:hypothetical protein
MVLPAAPRPPARSPARPNPEPCTRQAPMPCQSRTRSRSAPTVYALSPICGVKADTAPAAGVGPDPSMPAVQALGAGARSGEDPVSRVSTHSTSRAADSSGDSDSVSSVSSAASGSSYGSETPVNPWISPARARS